MKGEYLINAQGEDVVAGIRTPEPIARMAEVLPEAYEQFLRNVELLEHHFKDMQDVEFTGEHTSFCPKSFLCRCLFLPSLAQFFPSTSRGRQALDASMSLWKAYWSSRLQDSR